MKTEKTLIYDRKTRYGNLDSSIVLKKLNFFFKANPQKVFPENRFEYGVNFGKGIKTKIKDQEFSLFFLTSYYSSNALTLFFNGINSFTAYYLKGYCKTSKRRRINNYRFVQKKFGSVKKIIKFSSDQLFMDDFYFRSKTIRYDFNEPYKTLLAAQVIEEESDLSFSSKTPLLPSMIGSSERKHLFNPSMKSGVTILANDNEDRFLCFYPQNDQVFSCYFELSPFKNDYEPVSLY